MDNEVQNEVQNFQPDVGEEKPAFLSFVLPVIVGVVGLCLVVLMADSRAFTSNSGSRHGAFFILGLLSFATGVVAGMVGKTHVIKKSLLTLLLVVLEV